MGMTNFQRVQQWLVFTRQWHIVDATYQEVDILGEKVAQYLAGKHKPIYHPFSDCGDHVIVFNCQNAAMHGFDWKHREYFFNRDYPKSKRLFPSWEIQKFDPNRVLFMSIYAALGNNGIRRRHIERLHLFRDADIPDLLLENVSNQIEPPQKVPKRWDEYSEEERKEFPKIYEPLHAVLEDKVTYVEPKLPD